MTLSSRRLTLALPVAALAGALTLTAQVLPQDRGAAGAWQKLLKLKTTASALHTTAHPDDEHGGMLAMLSRRDGARVALLTLNRGEAGDNAIGPQLFDELGLVRTEELLVSNRYYGVDDQYFTTVLDYGFSKRIDEALEKWGKDNVLRDVVRVIRMNRPFVLISRFQGNERDGHGNHQTAGLLTQEAYKLAGDPKAYPEQLADGLRPWQPMKLYIGGVRENEGWTLKVDPGAYSPWLGDSYANVARTGLSFQRSQTSGRLSLVPGPQPGYYKRLASTVAAPDKETSFFDGIDTTLPGLFRALGSTASAAVVEQLTIADTEVSAAMQRFRMDDPAAVAPGLARGLAAIRKASELATGDPDVAFLLRTKDQQFQDAINAALGVELTALAQPTGVAEPAGPFAMFAAPPTMSNVVPGSVFDVKTTFVQRGGDAVADLAIGLTGAPGVSAVHAQPTSAASAATDQPVTSRFAVTVAPDASATNRPYFTRGSIADARYTLLDPRQFGRPAGPPALVAWARYTVGGTTVETRAVVRRREANLPYGYELRELAVVPALSVRISPASAVIPLAAATKRVSVEVEISNNAEAGTSGQVALTLPTGWTSDPVSHAFAFKHAGEEAVYRFTVTAPALEDRLYRIEAVATTGGREFREGYATITQRDLESRYLYRPATTTVRGIDVKTVPGLKIGYVMGVGDQVPAGIAQLGYDVTLLDDGALGTGDLSRFDAIVTGTRAYAVRNDLRTHNQRLLDYVKAGGNMIVLYNTAELVPDKFSPYPAELTPRAEEVSEEDAPVNILAATEQVLTWPNRITNADFDQWVEQRGSKFFSKWDAAYTPMIETWDRGQAPQQGGWLQARYGQGHYTYFAYALHRQLPYGVPGAYRLLANLLALGQGGD